MATKRLIAFTSEASPQLADSVYIHSNSAGQERRSTLTAIKTLLFGGKVVGGTAAGDIANIDSPQTFTNKRINNPGINSDTAVTADSAELNILDGASITTAELNRLSGVSSNVQDQLDGLVAAADSVTTRTYTYGTGTVTGNDPEIITEIALRTATGQGNLYRVDPDSIIVQLWQLDTSTWYLLPPVSGSNGQITFTTTIAGTTTVLNNISIKLDQTKSHKINVSYKLMQLAGV